MRKLFQGLSRGAWGVLIGKWMRERASVLEVEETANVVFAFSEKAGSGEPNPGLRPKKKTDVHAIVGCIAAYGHDKITLTIELCTANNLCYRHDSW